MPEKKCYDPICCHPNPKSRKKTVIEEKMLSELRQTEEERLEMIASRETNFLLQKKIEQDKVNMNLPSWLRTKTT
jgi:hypothetical protein